MSLKCIKTNRHGVFGSFREESYLYLLNRYGKNVADKALEVQEGIVEWNADKTKRLNVYSCRESRDVARFNKSLIEVVERGYEPDYSVAEGTITIDSYDGLDKKITVVF